MYDALTEYCRMLDQSFETDGSGQMYYVAQGSPTKVPIEESEYHDACNRLETRMGLSKIILFVVLGLSVVSVIALGLTRGLELQDALWLLAPFAIYFAAVAWASYSSVRPLELRRVQLDGSAKLTTSKKWAARAVGAVVWAIVLYYMIRANS